VCDLETSRMGAPYIYDISHLRVKSSGILCLLLCCPRRLEYSSPPLWEL